MYLKELYKSRTVDKYEGYDTIYNNEPRVKLPELIEHMERFTEVYKKNADAHPAIREANCFDAQYPTMMLGIAANDLFVGRADIFPLGFNAQYINGEWGFVMNAPWFEARMEDPEVTDNTTTSKTDTTTTDNDDDDQEEAKVWACNQRLDTPPNYSGGAVKLTLSQVVNGKTTEKTVIENESPTFPLTFSTEGAEGVSVGTVYVYEKVNGEYKKIAKYTVPFEEY